MSLSKRVGNYRIRILRRALSPHVKGSILDVGCGDTVLTYSLNKKAVGIDVRAPKKTNIKFFLYDGENIPFRDKSFDCLMCNFVLHHSKRPNKLLNEMCRVTKKRIIIFEDKYITLFDKIVVQLAHIYLLFVFRWTFNPFHFRSPNEWEKTFKKHKLKVIHKEFIKPCVPFFFIKHVLYILEKE